MLTSELNLPFVSCLYQECKCWWIDCLLRVCYVVAKPVEWSSVGIILRNHWLQHDIYALTEVNLLKFWFHWIWDLITSHLNRLLVYFVTGSIYQFELKQHSGKFQYLFSCQWLFYEMGKGIRFYCHDLLGQVEIACMTQLNSV